MKNKPNPPRLFRQFFRWFCLPRLRDHIEGDLMELYNERVNKKGRRKADILFVIDVLFLFRPGILRSFKQDHPTNKFHYGMFKNHIKTGWRRILWNKGYSFINIGGLAMGMTVALFIGLWIYDEVSFNKYHKNYDRIGQVWSGGIDPATSLIDGGYSVQYPLGDVLRSNYPGYFSKVLMVRRAGDHTLATADDKFSRKGEFIEPGGPEMLSLKMLQGSYECLKNPNSIILSKSTAIAIFGNADPMNKRLRIDNKMDAEVTGIYADIPRNNDFSQVQFFSSWALWVSASPWVKDRMNDWDNRPFNIYVELQPNVSAAAANAAIKDVYYKNIPADLLSTVDRYKPFVQVIPMNTWHLYTEFKDGKPAGGRIMFVWLFGIIGIFVLLLACINFINLSTARSEKRAKEVGVRKAIGSGKRQLVTQFLSESFLVVLLAFLISVVLMLVLKNWFNQLADKDISLPFDIPVFWLLAIGFILVTGFMAGLYPAFYLSSFRPVKVLKAFTNTGRFSAIRRKALVVFQFTVSVVLVIGTVVVYQQIQYARNRPVGYDRNNLITIPLNDPGFEGKYELLRNELLKSEGVSAVSASTNPLTAVWNSTSGYDWPGKDPNLEGEFGNIKIKHEFGKTVGWQFVKGRDFSKELVTDSANGVIINEAAAKYMGLNDPVGQRFVDLDEFGKLKRAYIILGVVKDLVMSSPYEPVKQTIFYFNQAPPSLLHIRLKPNASAAGTISKIEATFKNIVPSALFEYRFVDEEYANKFSQEERIGKLSGVFAILAVLISCLGLTGLASYVAEQRTKEIGIRKVLGASVTGLWQMLSKDFIIIVFISCIIAIPIGYFLMTNWLEKYAYRTEISWWIFPVTTFSAVIITILTVSFQSVRAAMVNPVKCLRAE